MLQSYLIYISTAGVVNTTGLPPLVTPQEFLNTMLGLLSSQAGVNLNNSRVPSNITELTEMLRNYSISLQRGGEIWDQVDSLGRTSTMIYRYVGYVSTGFD